MKKNLTELVFILDRSGSMQGLEGDTIGGFNAMIEKQKKEPGEAFVSTVLFDDQTEVLHDRVELGNVRPITDKEYYVRGCTALLDTSAGFILKGCDTALLVSWARVVVYDLVVADEVVLKAVDHVDGFVEYFFIYTAVH